MPFTAEQFFQVFARYSPAVFPAPIAFGVWADCGLSAAGPAVAALTFPSRYRLKEIL